MAARIKVGVALAAVAVVVILVLQNFGLINHGIPAKALFWSLSIPLGIIVLMAVAIGLVLGLLAASHLFGKKR